MKINKCILTFLTLICYCTANSQVIEMTNKKVSQLIFPSSIKTVKGGFIPDDFIMDIQDNVLYIQPLTSFSESNLNVVTTDNIYYTFTIRYNENAVQLNHIVKVEQSIFGANKQNDVFIEKTVGENIQKKILQDNDFFSRKAIRHKTTYIYLRGVYVNEDKLYIKLAFENQSNIPYDFEYVGFYIKEKKQRKNSTQEQVQLMPESIYPETIKGNVIKPKSSIVKVYTFPKFTIGQEKILLIDMIEKGGERNLSLKIDDSTILKAKKYGN